MSAPTSQPRRSARRNTNTALDLESEPDSAPQPVKSPKPKKGHKQIHSNADEVASKCKKKDEQDNNNTTDNESNASSNNTTGGDDMSGEKGRVGQGSGQGGKAAPLRGKGGKRGGKGKGRKTHAERAVEDDAEDAKGSSKKLTP
ncbi:hypothetical protein K443DRAFT_4257 [Laccaria amethystina LaAM-08-1]|uniref:Uncharacterized protein n=1 Tax=Laccaria amethystina LaAM-08-1 TaxID=1095629 RepID=A0A0C9YA50_9AGAR|nr:hypothetical protein K443DRAFT_4257 [Laccaria amethystina LaAM-08-1]